MAGYYKPCEEFVYGNILYTYITFMSVEAF